MTDQTMNTRRTTFAATVAAGLALAVGTAAADTAVSANPPTFAAATDQLARVCPFATLTDDCVRVACEVVALLPTQPDAIQSQFGLRIAVILDARRPFDESLIEKIRSCAAGGPTAFRQAFADAAGSSVASIGDPQSASPQ